MGRYISALKSEWRIISISLGIFLFFSWILISWIKGPVEKEEFIGIKFDIQKSIDWNEIYQKIRGKMDLKEGEDFYISRNGVGIKGFLEYEGKYSSSISIEHEEENGNHIEGKLYVLLYDGGKKFYRRVISFYRDSLELSEGFYEKFNLNLDMEEEKKKNLLRKNFLSGKEFFQFLNYLDQNHIIENCPDKNYDTLYISDIIIDQYNTKFINENENGRAVFLVREDGIYDLQEGDITMGKYLTIRIAIGKESLTYLYLLSQEVEDEKSF